MIRLVGGNRKTYVTAVTSRPGSTLISDNYVQYVFNHNLGAVPNHISGLHGYDTGQEMVQIYPPASYFWHSAGTFGWAIDTMDENSATVNVFYLNPATAYFQLSFSVDSSV